jgi:hypothetical protein
LVDLRADQFDLRVAQVHIKRAKNGIPSIHGLSGGRATAHSARRA